MAQCARLVEWFRAGSLGMLDWSIVALYLVASVAIGVYFTRRSSRSMTGYFVSGRSMTWWLLGTSMIATSFAADTPLVITSYIRTRGMWANWMWMSLATGQLLAVFTFSLFWRRAEVLTDNQLIEMRYSGRPAAVLRAFKASFGATIYNFIVMGWVLTAMGNISEIVLGIPKVRAVILFSVITLAYSMTGGLWAVVATDFFQFAIAMGGMVVLAFYAVDAVGGLEAMRASLAALGTPGKLDVLPPAAEGFAFGSPMFDLAVFMLVGWWAWQGSDGGGYLMQRMAAARDDRHSRLGMLWFVVGTYAVRLWPWVIVAAASLILFPTVAGTQYAELGEQAGFPLVMNRVLVHPGLLGLMVTVFIAAFMSTISTHLNWGASYVMNDIYRRFLVRNGSERHYVVASYGVNVIILAVAGYVAIHLGTIARAWEFVRALGAGIGAILILRWFWWRINAWTEITALATSLAVTAAFEIAATLQHGADYRLFETPLVWRGLVWTFTAKLLVIIPASLAAGLAATWLTAPTERRRLVDFFRKVRPGGAWGTIPAEAGVESAGLSWRAVGGWVASVGFIYSLTFGIGKLIFGPTWLGWALLAASAAFGGLTALAMRERGDGA